MPWNGPEVANSVRTAVEPEVVPVAAASATAGPTGSLGSADSAGSASGLRTWQQRLRPDCPACEQMS